MNTWRRAHKNERCGFCEDHVFNGGEPVYLRGAAGLVRCAAVAKARYGQDVPVPFPEPEVPVPMPTLRVDTVRRPDFASVGTLRRSPEVMRQIADIKQRQTGETD